MSRLGLFFTTVTLPLTLLACGTGDPAGGPDAGDTAPRGLDLCGGAALERMWQVNNLRGEIVAMTTAPDGTVVLATSDGAVKQWSLGTSADQAPLPGGRPSYGEPLTEAGSAVRALTVTDGHVLGGDADGALRQWTLPGAEDAGSRALATAPFTAIAPLSSADAVVADSSFGGAMRVVPLDGGAAGEAFATALWGVTTIEVDGTALYTAGHDYGTAAVERRDAASPATATDTWDDLLINGWVRDVAISPDGTTVLAGGDGFLLTLDAAALAAGPVAQIATPAALSVAFTHSGAHVAMASDGRVAIWDAALTAEVASAAVPGAIAIAVDPSGDRLVVASSDGTLHALVCR